VKWPSARRLRFVAIVLAVAAFYAASWHLAQVSPAKLATGLPKMVSWARKAWPPATDELSVLLRRAAETVAMAAIGTTAAALLALPVCALAARNVTPSLAVYYPIRWLLNGLRGIDSFVFALLFVPRWGSDPSRACWAWRSTPGAAPPSSGPRRSRTSRPARSKRPRPPGPRG